MNSIGDNSKQYTGGMSDYPCVFCKRKNCTMTVTSNGPCDYYIDTEVHFKGYSYEPRNYVKRNHGKKRSYHRGKF